MRPTGNQTRRVKFTFSIAHRFPTPNIFLKKENNSHTVLFALICSHLQPQAFTSVNE